MEATSGRTRTRLIVVDFLATLFVTFCIGIATALVLGACVMLMTGKAHGTELRNSAAPTKAPAKPRATAAPAQATAADFVLAHYFAAKYTGLVAIDRVHTATVQESEGKGASLPRR